MPELRDAKDPSSDPSKDDRSVDASTPRTSERAAGRHDALTRDGAATLPGGAPPLRPLLASAGHELRSPLQAIRGFADLLDSEAYGGLSREQHGFVQNIAQASDDLSSALEACLELAELHLLGRPQAMIRAELRAVIRDAVERARQRGLHATLLPGPDLGGTHVRIERASFERAFEVLLVAVGRSDDKRFHIAIEANHELARVLVSRARSGAHGSMTTLDELARRPRIARNLLWFQLASMLFAGQGASLLLGEQLDCAEVRLRLSSTH